MTQLLVVTASTAAVSVLATWWLTTNFVAWKMNKYSLLESFPNGVPGLPDLYPFNWRVFLGASAYGDWYHKHLDKVMHDIASPDSATR